MSILTSGSLVAGRYRANALLGRGGIAEVWAAIDEPLHRQVVVKVFDQDVAGAFRTSDELELLTAVRHDGLVAVLDVGAADATGCPYLVTEYVDGPSLRQRIDQGDPLPRDLVAEVGAQLADTLACLHATGVSHRGVQPGNVLLTTRDCADGSTAITAKLMDLGTARLKDTIRMTEYGAVGRSGHDAPEFVRRADDVYSLGLVLLECFIGYVAYSRHGRAGAFAPTEGPPPVPPTVAPAWTYLLTRMFAADPAHRPATSEVADALRELAADDRRLRLRLQCGENHDG
jgi:serine/threonine protein kinase